MRDKGVGRSRAERSESVELIAAEKNAKQSKDAGNTSVQDKMHKDSQGARRYDYSSPAVKDADVPVRTKNDNIQ